MCGLMGLVTGSKAGFTRPDMETMMGVLFLTQLRGPDSTGVCSIMNTNEVDFHKALGTPDKLMTGESWPQFYGEMLSDGKAMFGHCRSATKGTVNIDNAHPFWIEREDKTELVLAHNGTLHEHQQLKGLSEYEVDSHWLAAMVAEHGAEEALGKINGPIACIWYDTRDKSLNWYRNNERPLFVAQTKDGKILLQSEKETMIWAKHKYKLSFDQDEIREVQPYHKHTVIIDKGVGFTSTPLPRKPWVYQTPAPHQPYVYGVRRMRGYEDSLDTGWENRQELAAAARRRSRDESALTGNITPIRPIGEYQGPPKDRGFLQDISHLLTGKIDHVRFANGIRMTKAGYVDSHTEMNPYEPGLSVLMRIDTKTVQAKWLSGKIKNYSAADLILTAKEAAETPGPKHQILTLPEKLKALEPLANKVRMKVNARIKFSTTHGKTNLNHEATCGPDIPHHFESYYNTKDGEIKLGDVVQMEVTETAPLGLRNTEAYGYRIKGEQDMVIGCRFTDDTRSEAEVKAVNFFEGRVAKIRMVSKKRLQETSNIVEVDLVNVVPLTEASAGAKYAIH